MHTGGSRTTSALLVVAVCLACSDPPVTRSTLSADPERVASAGGDDQWIAAVGPSPEGPCVVFADARLVPEAGGLCNVPNVEAYDGPVSRDGAVFVARDFNAEQTLLAGYADPGIVEIEALYPKGRREPVATATPDGLPYALWFIVVPGDGPAPAVVESKDADGRVRLMTLGG